MISRNYTWIDETIEHSEADCARASALAKKWSELQTMEENRRFAAMGDDNYYDPYEDCDCEWCTLANHDCESCEQCSNPEHECSEACCSLCSAPRTPGIDECQSAKADRLAREERQAERDLEIELIEDKLAAIGARIMRPYEHWNEDERYMEYMETRYDYEY